MEEVKLSPETIVKDLCKLSNEIWKIEKKIKKCEGKLNEDENKAFSFLIDKVNGIIGNYNIKTVDYTNEKWIEGMNMLDIIGAEEKDGIEYDIIGESICPVIELNGEIIQRSKVVIYKPKQQENNYSQQTEKRVFGHNKKVIMIIIGIILIIAILLLFLFSKFLKGNNNSDSIVTNTGILQEGTGKIFNIETIYEGSESENLISSVATINGTPSSGLEVFINENDILGTGDEITGKNIEINQSNNNIDSIEVNGINTLNENKID